MMKKKLSPEDTKPAPLNVQIQSHIVRDLQTMEKNTKIPVSELVSKALLMFIATHNDYLGRGLTNQGP